MELKIALVIIIVGVTNIFAGPTYSQTAKVSLDMKNQNLEQVLDEIERQSEFYFIFNQKQINVDRTVDVSAENKTIAEVLDNLFAGTDVKYAVLDRKILLTTEEIDRKAINDFRATADQQQTTVTGVVTDGTNNEPMIGVNIQLKGTTTGAISGVDGSFTMTYASNPDAILVFSFIGYATQEIPVGSNKTVNVTMQADVLGLEEVVVVGYGTVKKETLTGSVANITASDIVSTKSENLINNIQGKVSGLMVRQLTGEPGKFNNYVSIRGFGAPLVIIDGVVRDGTSDMAQLNSDDIESMSVLKDAAASIYGMNAANGVIIVTTKKGQEGRAQFSYSNLLGFKGATGLEYTVDAYTYRLMKNEMDRNSGTTETYTPDILEKYRLGEAGYTDNNWLKLTMHDNVFQQSHNFSVRGGTNAVKYYNSFGYTEDNGLLKSGIQYYRRYNLRSTTTADLTKNLKLNVSVAGRIDANQSPREAFLWTFKTIMVNDRGINYHTIANPNHLSVIPPESKNAMALIDPEKDGYNRQRNIQFQSTIDLSYSIPKVPGLTISAVGAFDQNIANTSYLQKSYELYDYYTDQYSQTTGSDQYSNEIGLFQRAVARGQATYTKTSGKHKINATGVIEFTGTRSDDVYAKRLYQDLFTNDIINQGTSTTASNSGYRSFGKYAAYIGRVNYDFAGKYLVEVVGRYDGSYRYAKANRWAFFPSASIGWRLSEEPIIKDNLPIFSNLKLRGSYGESGTDAGNPFAYYSAYTVKSVNSNPTGYIFNDGSMTVSMVAPGVVTDDLSWVTSKISNIGVDFELWKGKLGGAFEVFERRNTGMLATLIQSVPNTFGADFPQVNINSNLNHGFEIMLSHRNKIGSDFNFGITANYTYTRTKRLHQENAGYSSSWDYWRNSVSDRYTGYMGLYEYDGKYENIEEYETAPLLGGNAGNSKMLPGSFKLIDVNGDGIINGNDQTYDHWTYGTVNPPMQYGLTLDASYKGFDINMLFQGAAGYTINYRNNDIWGYGRYPTLHEKFLDRWHTANTTDDPYNPSTEWVSGFYPALRNYNYNNTTEANVIDVWRPNATYLRLKSLEIGYTLPKSFVSRVGLSNGRIFVNGYNLLTFCNKLLKDADPERQEADWDANLNYPLMKSYNFGVNINF
ncbi:MAG TPA: TonB-dependent receptor [Bacteroidales bacterium]|nr:TonB-dependent receptor [Bacteroidales bacterium]